MLTHACRVARSYGSVLLIAQPPARQSLMLLCDHRCAKTSG